MAKRKLSGSLTVRLNTRSMRELKVRARKARKTTSEVVREILDRELAPNGSQPKTAYELTKDLVGSLHIDDPRVFGENVRETMKSWNPDRRG